MGPPPDGPVAAVPAHGRTALTDTAMPETTDRIDSPRARTSLARQRVDPPTGTAPAPPPAPERGRTRPLLDHLPFGAVLLAGVVLRVLTWRAYRPALLYPDSRSYLLEAANTTLGNIRPSGYSVFIWPLVRLDGLASITLLQHLMGLAMAVAIYLLLLRLWVWPWLAALATAPLLLDSMQLVLEQYVMSDVLFQALLLAACLLLLWRRRPGASLLLAAGLALGLAATVRGAGLLLAAPAAVAVLALGLAGGWRQTVALLAALLAGVALPVGVYMLAYKQEYGRLAMTSYTSRFLYSRLAPIVDCRGLALPDYERTLCPPEPVGQRMTTNEYMWALKRSPQYRVRPPAGKTTQEVLAEFNRRIILHQPVDYAGLVARDFVRGFQPFRTVREADVPVTPWQFAPAVPRKTGVPDRAELYRRFAGYGPVVDRPSASWLTDYQHLGHTPGPVLAGCAVVALLAAAGVGRARRSGLRVAAWTFASLCLVALVTAAMSSTFSWRYQLVQLVLLPPAGALGLTALVRRRSPDDQPSGQVP
jgi:hypothetical protein